VHTCGELQDTHAQHSASSLEQRPRFIEHHIPLLNPEMQDTVINMLAGGVADDDDIIQAEAYDVYLKQKLRPSKIAEWFLNGLQTGD
jgi:hypothetical protein